MAGTMRAGEAAGQWSWRLQAKGAEPTGARRSVSLPKPCRRMTERGSPASRSDKEYDLTQASHGGRPNGRKSISASWPSGSPPRHDHRGDFGDVLKSIERNRCLRPRIIAGLDSKVIASTSSAAASQGSSRMRRFLNSTGEPSDSRQRNPEWGSQPVPPETSSPLTQSLISPLIPRT